jgi:hypothetical protein
MEKSKQIETSVLTKLSTKDSSTKKKIQLDAPKSNQKQEADPKDNF